MSPGGPDLPSIKAGLPPLAHLQYWAGQYGCMIVTDAFYEDHMRMIGQLEELRRELREEK